MSCKEVADRVGTWANVTKVIMGICFLLLFILGTALFLAACVALADASIFSSFAITGFREIIIFALCLGLFIALVSIVGALGYFTLNKAMLIIFTCGIAILVILQVACGATAVAYRDDYDNITASAWELAEESTRAYFQEQFKCCGGVNLTDHVANSTHCLAYNDTLFFDDIGAKSTSGSDFTHGCVASMVETISDNVVAVGIGDIVITVLEIAVIVVTVVVVVKVHRARSYQQFKDEDAIEQLRD